MTDTGGHLINGGSTADPCSFVPWYEYILSLFMGEYYIRGTEADSTVVREGKKNISEAEFLHEIQKKVLRFSTALL
jgi:hypothetical protein